MCLVNCEFCGKEVEKALRFIKKYKTFYCNKRCQIDHIKSKRTIVKCSACGIDIILSHGRKHRSRTGL